MVWQIYFRFWANEGLEIVRKVCVPSRGQRGVYGRRLAVLRHLRQVLRHASEHRQFWPGDAVSRRFGGRYWHGLRIPGGPLGRWSGAVPRRHWRHPDDRERAGLHGGWIV